MLKMSGKIGLVGVGLDVLGLYPYLVCLEVGCHVESFLGSTMGEAMENQCYTSDEPTQANRAEVRTPCIHASRLTL